MKMKIKILKNYTSVKKIFTQKKNFQVLHNI